MQTVDEFIGFKNNTLKKYYRSSYPSDTQFERWDWHKNFVLGHKRAQNISTKGCISQEYDFHFVSRCPCRVS